ncbi:MAG: hypothetical protein IPN79_01695 [Saprospiraceae bacterium]|nr:hypothetical protein [Saprospiraceae bacterium]
MDTNTKDIIFLLPENQYNLHPGTGTEQDFVIVIRSVEYQPELLIQLEAILKAIQVDLSQRATIVEILNDTDCRLKEIYPVSAYVFVFGMSPSQTGFPSGVAKYNLISSGDSMYLFSDSLQTLKSAMEAKKQLWNCLKSHFIDKK